MIWAKSSFQAYFFHQSITPISQVTYLLSFSYNYNVSSSLNSVLVIQLISHRFISQKQMEEFDELKIAQRVTFDVEDLLPPEYSHRVRNVDDQFYSDTTGEMSPPAYFNIQAFEEEMSHYCYQDNIATCLNASYPNSFSKLDYHFNPQNLRNISLEYKYLLGCLKFSSFSILFYITPIGVIYHFIPESFLCPVIPRFYFVKFRL